jgi:predicted transcriptional regulator of viral defense system
MPRAKSLTSIDTKISRHIQRCARGSVFLPDTFAAFGSRAAIDKALQRLVKEGTLRRLSRGLYDKPAHDELFGTLWPSVESVVKAVAGKDKLRTQPIGVYAANMLGLSEQVPAKVVLLTDGISRKLKAGPIEIRLQRTTPKQMAAAGRLSGLMIQAFKSMGMQHITPAHIERLRKNIPATERAKLMKDLALAPAWMRPLILQVAQEDTMTELSVSSNKKIKV